MSHRARIRRLWPAALFAVALSVAALFVGPSAVAKFGGNEPCVAPNGLKQLYGYSVSVVSPDCNRIGPGERWSASVPWIMNSSFAQKPSGFATDFSTPVDDLRGKLRAIEYVVDPGSPYQSNRSFPGDNELWEGTLPEAAGLPAVDTATVGSLDPLPVGQHSVEVYWDLRGPHCDGFTADQGTSCLPAGRTLVRRISFDVAAPQETQAG